MVNDSEVCSWWTMVTVTTKTWNNISCTLPKQGCALREIEGCPVLWTCKIQSAKHMICISLRKHPFLLTLRRWGRFARRNVCDSATEIPTDDVKSVRNPVRSADWSTQQFHCFSYCLWMTDKKQKATKVKCKRKESLTKQSIFVEYKLLLKKHLNFAGVRGQINTTLYQNRPEDTQN